MPTLDVGLTDIGMAAAAFAASLGVFLLGMSGLVTFRTAIALYAAVCALPLGHFATCVWRGGGLTMPVLLSIATVVAGPVGAAGCAVTALVLWRRKPSPVRLQEWYDYISGVVERGQVTHLYEELSSGRLPPDNSARVPRFAPILIASSIEDQQRVLGVIGRRYHGDFRPILKRALRNRNGVIRAQAAAVATQLDLEEKARLWSNETAPGRIARAEPPTLRLIERDET